MTTVIIFRKKILKHTHSATFAVLRHYYTTATTGAVPAMKPEATTRRSARWTMENNLII